MRNITVNETYNFRVSEEEVRHIKKHKDFSEDYLEELIDYFEGSKINTLKNLRNLIMLNVKPDETTERIVIQEGINLKGTNQAIREIIDAKRKSFSASILGNELGLLMFEYGNSIDWDTITDLLSLLYPQSTMNKIIRLARETKRTIEKEGEQNDQ